MERICEICVNYPFNVFKFNLSLKEYRCDLKSQPHIFIISCMNLVKCRQINNMYKQTLKTGFITGRRLINRHLSLWVPDFFSCVFAGWWQDSPRLHNSLSLISDVFSSNQSWYPRPESHTAWLIRSRQRTNIWLQEAGLDLWRRGRMREFVTLKALFVPVSECLINEQSAVIKRPHGRYHISPSSLLMGSSSSSPRPLCRSGKLVCILRFKGSVNGSLDLQSGRGSLSRENNTEHTVPQHFWGCPINITLTWGFNPCLKSWRQNV